jgi:hypothetical protein
MNQALVDCNIYKTAVDVKPNKVALISETFIKYKLFPCNFIRTVMKGPITEAELLDHV